MRLVMKYICNHLFQDKMISYNIYLPITAYKAEHVMRDQRSKKKKNWMNGVLYFLEIRNDQVNDFFGHL